MPLRLCVQRRIRGRSASCLAVELSQDGKVFLTAQVWTTNREDGPDRATIAASRPTLGW